MPGCEFFGNNITDGWMLVFAGQGSPTTGMGNDVCDVSPGVKAVWDCASDISGIDMRKLCQKGPMMRLTKTNFQQLAVTTVNIAMLTVLRERYPLEESGYAGHSVGEYSALYGAGVLDLETLFRAIGKRGEIMQELAECRKGVMYALKPLNYRQLRVCIQDMGLANCVNIACDNGHFQQVLGGDIDAVKAIIQRLTPQGVTAVKLAVNGAWHTPLMQDGVDEMRRTLAALPFNKPKRPLIMNHTAAIERDVDTIRENLALHLTQTVRWRESMELWWSMGYRRYMEIGHKKVLSYLLDTHYENNEPPDIQHFHAVTRGHCAEPVS